MLLLAVNAKTMSGIRIRQLLAGLVAFIFVMAIVSLHSFISFLHRHRRSRSPRAPKGLPPIISVSDIERG